MEGKQAQPGGKRSAERVKGAMGEGRGRREEAARAAGARHSRLRTHFDEVCASS